MPLVFVARAVALLRWRWLRALGALLGAFVGSVLRVRRAHVESALRRAALPEAAARAMYASLGAALLEFLWMVGRPRTPLSFVRLTPRAHRALAAHASAGRGVVVATAHTGNWDLVACASASHVPLAVATKRLSVRWLDQFWQRERAARGIELLHGAGTLRRAMRALERGRSVAMLFDQAPERGSAYVRARFMGETANCDLAPAMLAARAKVPLVLALGHRNADGTHDVDVPLVLEPPPRASRAWMEEATRRLNEALETFVRERPEQWLWLHRRWKGAPRRPPRREVAGSLAVC